MSFNDFDLYIGYLFLLINLILYSKSYRKESVAFRTIVIYLLITFIIQITAHVFSNKGNNNLFLSHYYFIGQFALLSAFYYQILKNSIHLTVIKMIFGIVLITLSVQFFINPKLYWKFSLLEVVICGIPLVLYALFYFYESFGVKHKKYLLLNAGVFFYLLSNTLIFTTGNYLLLSNSSLVSSIYALNAYLYIVFQVFIFIEWYQNFRETAIISTDDTDEFLK